MNMGLLVAMYVESGGKDSYICIHMFFCTIHMYTCIYEQIKKYAYIQINTGDGDGEREREREINIRLGTPPYRDPYDPTSSHIHLF